MATPLSPEARAWQTKYETWGTDSLTRARATAKEWTGSISAITGLLALVSVIKGRENIEDLTDYWSRRVYIALTAALVLALVAIVVGAIAAQGSLPALGDEPSRWRKFWAAIARAEAGPFGKNWQGVRDLTHNEAKVVRSQLAWSRLAAFLAGLLLIFAVATTWMAPTNQQTAPVTVLVVRKDGTFACGDLAKSSKPGVIFVAETKGKPATEIQVAEVLTVASAKNCP